MERLRRRNFKSAQGGATAGAVVLFVILIGIMAYVLLIPPQYREELGLEYLPPINYTAILLSESPGLLSAGVEGEVETYSHDLASITVDNAPKEAADLIVSQALVKKSLITAQPLSFSFDVPGPEVFSSAEVNFNTIEVGGGKLVVSLNDRKIFSGAIEPGRNVRIPLPAYLIKESNDVRISVSSPGWRFWAVNSYLLSDLYLVKYEYTSPTAIVEQVISLTDKEVRNIKEAKVQGYIKQRSVDSAKLELKVNGNLVYTATPVGTPTLSVSIPTDFVRSGSNSLVWAVDKDGTYDILWVKLVIRTTALAVNRTIAQYTFSVSEGQWDKVKDPGYACELYLTRLAGDAAINIDLNNNALRYTFTNGKISKNVCEYLQRGINAIVLTADEQIAVGTLSITIKNK